MTASETAQQPPSADPLPPATATSPSAAVPPPFFHRVDWIAFWTAFLVAFLVYGFTLAPTVTLEDSGELAVGSTFLGVPHPPGYPIWTIITWVFTKLFFFVTFRGQPNPAWAVGLASAFFGALASGVTAILLCRSGRDLLRGIRQTGTATETRLERWICWSGGVAASLVFAFSPVNWSQNVIVEVYALNAFLLVTLMFLAYVWMRRPDEPLRGLTWFILGIALTCLLVMGSRVVLHLLTYKDFADVGVHYVLGYLLLLLLVSIMSRIWRQRPGDRLLYLISLTFGLGLTNYQVLLLLLASLAVVVLVKDIALFRDFVIAGAPFALFYALVRLGVVQHLIGPYPQVTYLGIIHPTHPLTYLYLAANFGLLALVYRFLPNGRRVAPAILCLELGLAVYVFMPLASETNPPINWGYPRTWDGFVHAISRGQYERIVPTAMVSSQFVRQVGEYIADLRVKFLLPVVILGLLPFTAWHLRIGRHRFRALYVALGLTALSVLLIGVEEWIMPTGTEWRLLSRLYRALIVGAGSLALIGVAMMVLAEVEELALTLFGRCRAALSARCAAGAILVAMLAVPAYVGGKVVALLLDPALPIQASERVGLLILLLSPLAAAALIYAGMRHPAGLSMDFDRDDQKWLLATLAGFLVMSLVMVALASPKGDIQDEFVQRVKFISSHALFAFWIGYGLVLGLAALLALDRGRHGATWIGIVAVPLLLPALPLVQNACNSQLLRTDGGAEQWGHDFGWQFGNYALRGADAITEELAPDEEPLPNPAYPPALEPRAIFFGGTDPGRFVPTYMIYCARVRPDIYLITQNALADSTYMNVMRNLYGDHIWIPSADEASQSFRRYFDDVSAGRTPPSADIKMEAGRVKIEGVGGVMAINGILCRMIFDRNKARHAFYLEESYAIPWMYPYLTPHGLILRIDAEPLAILGADRVRDDLDFWDWYTQRLCGNPRFVRDVCARKSFSKLRSAIAGVYAMRRMNTVAEQALAQAVALYPLSPEASFRLADLYSRWGRGLEAIRVMEAFARADPGNARVQPFIRDLEARHTRQARQTELEQVMSAGQGTVGMAMELADIYRKSGQPMAFHELLQNLCSQKGLPPDANLYIAQMAAEERNPVLMEIALANYTAAMPADLRGWIDLAAVRFVLQKDALALEAVQHAIALNPQEARALLLRDARYDPARTNPVFRQLIGQP